MTTCSHWLHPWPRPQLRHQCHLHRSIPDHPWSALVRLLHHLQSIKTKGTVTRLYHRILSSLEVRFIRYLSKESTRKQLSPFSPSKFISMYFLILFSPPPKKSCLVIRIKHLITHRKLSKLKSKILTTCLQGIYRDSLGEFSNTSYVVFGDERVRPKSPLIHHLCSFFKFLIKFITMNEDDA